MPKLKGEKTLWTVEGHVWDALVIFKGAFPSFLPLSLQSPFTPASILAARLSQSEASQTTMAVVSLTQRNPWCSLGAHY